jgi:hypothetical protein
VTLRQLRRLRYGYRTPTSEPTQTETVAPTVTSTETATFTPTATATTTPTPQPTVAVSIPPYAGAPKCTEHDASWWHPLWNASLGCHYDHEHGSNPNGMASYVISGTSITYGALEAFNGQQLGYVWQTTQ